MNMQALIGKTYSYLTIIGDGGKSGRDRFVLCKCNCGQVLKRRVYKVITGHTKSCGCMKSPHGHTTHRDASPTYQTWVAMRYRCRNPNHEAYEHYGGRGISVCKRWNVFTNFLEDMGERPKGKSLERKDTDGNYEPSNCVWATSKEQARNTRRNRLLTYKGKTLPLCEWAELMNLGDTTLRERIRRGWPVAKALTTPVARRT